MRRTNWLAAAVRVLAVVLLFALLAPKVQAALRPRVPPTAAMRSASAAVEGFEHSPAPPQPPAQPGTLRESLLVEAYALRGIPYEWGAKGPDRFDCSGFTRAAYDAIGVQLPDGSFNQAAGEQPLHSVEDLTPGDLLFYRWHGEVGVTHVTMYAGDGWAIGTGSPGQPAEVTVYPLSDDLRVRDTVITFRHVPLPDE